jgi:predicted nucleic acid-binding protein
VGGLNTLLVVDASAWHRIEHPEVQDAWQRQLFADRVAMTAPAKLEILYSARSAKDYEWTAKRLGAFQQVPCGEDAWDRALEVQAALAKQHDMHHRSVQGTDLLIAAAAELVGATVWHYDSDYDRITAVTGQPTEWIVPRGSI